MPWIAAGHDRHVLLERDHRRAGLASPGYAAPLPRPLDEEPERVAVADDLAHQPDRLAVGLAAAHRERAERADQLPDPRDAVQLDLGQVVDRPRTRGAEGRRIEPREVVEREDDAALARHALAAVDAERREARARRRRSSTARRAQTRRRRWFMPHGRGRAPRSGRRRRSTSRSRRVDHLRVLGRLHARASLSSRSAEVGGERVGADVRPLGLAALRADPRSATR